MADETPILHLADFVCPHCKQQPVEPPLPEGRHPRSAAFSCVNSACPVGLFYVATGAPTYRDKIMTIIGIRLLADFHEKSMRQEYTERTKKEADLN